MLTWAGAAAVSLGLAMAITACSDPDGYPGGGRYQTLPGQAGGLVAVDAGPPREAGTPATPTAGD